MTRRGESDDQTPPRPVVTPGAMRTQLIHMPDRLHPWFLAPVEPPRASFEFALTMALAPVLVAAHAADGHPVLVVPGLSGGDQWTLFIPGYLRAIGHSVFTPSRGTMRRRPAAVVARDYPMNGSTSCSPRRVVPSAWWDGVWAAVSFGRSR